MLFLGSLANLKRPKIYIKIPNPISEKNAKTHDHICNTSIPFKANVGKVKKIIPKTRPITISAFDIIL